jgi:hypothetical protein
METNNWILLCSFQQKYKAALVEAALEEKEIEFKIIDKVDSMFNFLGELEIYVQQTDYMTAKYIKENLEL